MQAGETSRSLDLSGALDARYAVVASRFNRFITDRLMKGARRALAAAAVADERVETYHAPGAYELPLVARWLAERGEIDGIVALGCVIRGDTPHFDYVCSEAARGLSRVQLDFGLPVGFGVLTVETFEQAAERARPGSANKGAEAALAVMEMVSLKRRLGGDRR